MATKKSSSPTKPSGNKKNTKGSEAPDTTADNNSSTGNRKKMSPIQLMRLILFAISAFGCVVIAMIIKQPIVWAAGSTGALLGEELLDSDDAARNYADRSVQEVYSILTEPSSNWQVMHNTTATTKATKMTKIPLTVECRKVTEKPFEDSTIHLARAKGILMGVTPREVYEFIVSAEGLALIDPLSDPLSSSSRNFEEIPNWREGTSAKSRIEESFVTSKFLFNKRQYVLLNVQAPDENLYVSKSILHGSHPMSTTNNVRAYKTFAIKIDPITLENTEEEVVTIQMINYIDLKIIPESLMSYYSCKFLFPDILQKLQKTLNDKQKVGSVE